MKRKMGVLGVALVSACMLMRTGLAQPSVTVEVGDRDYYEGPTYWDNGYEYVWTPGRYDEHHTWVHGTYTRHGEFVKEHEKEHHVFKHEHDHDHDHD